MVSISTNYWHVIPWCHILLVQDIWYQLNGIKFYWFQACDTNWMVLVLTISRLVSYSSRSSYLIPIKWHHILPISDILYQVEGIFIPVPEIWYQLNDIIFYKFRIYDTNWIVSCLTSSRHFIPKERYDFTSSRNLIPIEWHHILPVSDILYQLEGIFVPVPEIWYQLNDIIFYKFQINDTNWIVSYLTSSRYFIPKERYISTSSRNLIPIEWYHILRVPDIWYQLNGISFNQFLTCDTNWMVSYHFQTCDTNWMVSYSTRSRYLITIEWYHILPVPDTWCQLNGIISYQIQTFVPSERYDCTSSRNLILFKLYHILQIPNI